MRRIRRLRVSWFSAPGDVEFGSTLPSAIPHSRRPRGGPGGRAETGTTRDTIRSAAWLAKICRPVYSDRMATKGASTRARLAESMLELIQLQGYAGTGLNTVTAHARAPKGSLYFHFPDGKEALGEQA